jgi:hypothetical protein
MYISSSNEKQGQKLDKKQELYKYIKIVIPVILLIGVAVKLLKQSPDDVIAPITEITKQISDNQFEKYLEFHASLNSEEESLRKAYEETKGVRTETWKQFGLQFSKRIKESSKKNAKDFQFDDVNGKPLKKKLIEGLIRQTQMLVFLWREMNSKLQERESRIPLAEKELLAVKNTVLDLIKN